MTRTGPWALAMALLAEAAVAQVPAGGEFQVNSGTTASQTAPAVAVAPGGGFVVTWFDTTAAPLTTVEARRFDRAGGAQGPDFQVSSAGTTGARLPAVTADAKGRFAIVWSDVLPSNGQPLGVFARVLDPLGVATSDEFRVSAGPSGDAPAVGAVPGGFVAAWSADGDVFARRFDVRGNLRGQQVAVNTYTTGAQFDADVAGQPDGGFLVVWTDSHVSPSSVFARRFDAADTPNFPPFEVDITDTVASNRPRVATDAAGNFVIVWQQLTAPPRLIGWRFTANGTSLGLQFVVSTLPTAAAYHALQADATGEFVVAWQARDLDGDGYGVFARRFLPDATPRGPAFVVNTYTTGSQVLPDVATDGNGNLTTVWMSGQLNQTDSEVFGQRVGGLIPDALTVADGANEVLELDENFTLVTSWRNVSGAAQTFQGASSQVQAPPGILVNLSPDAVYGTVPAGTAGSCTVPCFAGRLFGTRPPGEADVAFLESILPDTLGQRKRWVLHVGGSFTDVPRTSQFYRFIETLLHRGITSGCGGTAYCPASSATREQMSVFVLAAKEGSSYAPPACTTPVFGDVPASSPFCRWIEELARRGVSGGCGGGNYCPGDPVSREQMAVFVLRTLDPNLSPPACTTPVFGDVPATSPFCRWIEDLARRGITGGCGGGNYCPTAPVTREQMAVFLTGTFGLTLYGP
jgi:S-layer family protein